MVAMTKIVTITTATQSHDLFYRAWQDGGVCPICTDRAEITWSDLIADRVEFCDEHRAPVLAPLEHPHEAG